MAKQCISGLKLIGKFVKDVWPKVDCSLDEYISLAKQAKDNILSQQALSSIQSKRFHALGGSAYALYPGVDMNNTVKFIAALQTISDYLDNLCDRVGVEDEQAFRQLHLAMLDAVEPAAASSDYYQYYPYKVDNGYLKALVEECRRAAEKLPSYELVKGRMKQLVGLYSDLQTFKHLNNDVRAHMLSTWANSHISEYPGVSWWEFSAVTGSTLEIFMLFAAAHNPRLTEAEVELIHSSYFPWISGLHILLDYYIDSAEDIEGGDLNFTHYYCSMEQCKERLSYFIGHSLESCMKLEYPEFHLTVTRGLLAMYLSDAKAHSAQNKEITFALIDKGGLKTGMYFNLCRLLRHWGKL